VRRIARWNESGSIEFLECRVELRPQALHLLVGEGHRDLDAVAPQLLERNLEQALRIHAVLEDADRPVDDVGIVLGLEVDGVDQADAAGEVLAQAEVLVHREDAQHAGEHHEDGDDAVKADVLHEDSNAGVERLIGRKGGSAGGEGLGPGGLGG
jgi:hypothetical protein